jgi:hypothetical protein
MALWADTDSVPSLSTARVTVGSTFADNGSIVVTGTGTSFGLAGCARTGDVIRFGAPSRGTAAGAGHTYYGDAVIVSIANSGSITIGSSAGMSAIGFTTHISISRLPSYSVLDSAFSHRRTDADAVVYGISTTSSTTYSATHQGWVGVTTYIDNHGNLRVKNEVLVAMSGISTGLSAINQTPSIPYPTDAGRS